jgi:uncharacterized membrane protein
VQRRNNLPEFTNNNAMMIRFIFFGITGWCLEVIWTGFGSLLRGDFKMSSRTSVWMFFVYGCASFFNPIINAVLHFPLVVRGTFYVLVIFAIEFIAGLAMKQVNACPWDYSEAKLNVMGIIRLDYAPVWFAVGLLFEFMHVTLNNVLI